MHAAALLLSIILFADYSDPDVIRVGDDYYLTASSFSSVPGLPILHSRDLRHWTIVGYAAQRLPSPDFDRVQHGNGLWAPSLRHHDGWFRIYVGDPDRGIYVTRARDAKGPWEPLQLVHAAKGWIDPCPLWDDDGNVYLVHAFAKSRAGFNGVLCVHRMSADGERIVDEGTIVFDGRERHPTIEGPKFYKRNGWYYIFAPAGGVKTGWQTVLRSKNVLGPYEDRIVLDRRGYHQGAWVNEASGDAFVHFEDRDAYGRIVHVQKLRWVNDWPEIEVDDADSPPLPAPRGEGWGDGLGLQWQWQANPQPDWFTLRNGKLHLSRTPDNLQDAPNLLLQKLPAESFIATARISNVEANARAGLVVFGTESAALFVENHELHLGADTRRLQGSSVDLRVAISPGAVARFSFSTDDGKTFAPIGTTFVARPGKWVGARIGLFGPADFDFFRIEPFTPEERASLVVAQDGSGDFTTIQQAIDAIPQENAQNQTILIRNGTYREKLMIAKSHIALVGEDREKTRIVFAELRRNWRASHADDWGAAVINIGAGAADIVIANLTVHNDFGGDHDHQFAIRSMLDATRIAVLNANILADGGDTWSLWNHDTGLSYAIDSRFEGWVDYVCPRGWAYLTSCTFFGHSETASIWHDGSRDPDQKLVIRHSRFDGTPNIPLGRNHRDAQFYLLDVALSPNIADRAIYAADAPDPRAWGERYFYENVHRDGGDFAWHADNLRTAAGAPRDEDVTATWTFGGRWDPATLPSVLPFAAIPRPENGWPYVDPTGATLRWTRARNAGVQRVYFGTSKTPEFRREQRETKFETGPLRPGTTYYWRIDDGPLWTFTADTRTTRIALVGDSTVTEKSGWGRGFKSALDESVAVLNLAHGGRSSKSYRDEGWWEKALREKPTHILLQFGHNDMPGKGADRETDLPAFRANMARYVDEARAIGAKPILVTSLARREVVGSAAVSAADATASSPSPPGRRRDGAGSAGEDAGAPLQLADYAEATRQVAREKNVPLIDLHAKSLVLLAELGPSISASLGPLKFDGTLDRTHLTAEGSALFGAVVAEELCRLECGDRSHRFISGAKAATAVAALQSAWSMRVADSVMKRTPDPLWLDANEAPRWEYTPGLVLKAIAEVAQRTGDPRYAKYVEAYYDGMIADDGTIRGGYKLEDYNIDRINPGKPLFALLAKTKKEKYRKAIETLRRQMREHPRTSEGGFWHKKRYPHQMWLDGLYMGAPFLAQYAKEMREPALFDDVITQYVLMEKHARDDRTGLLFHGWDESREQKWSDPKTGRSPALWGRAMGWYAMGLVDTLDFIPLEHPRRRELIAILQRLAEAITNVQDPKSSVWWQVVDQPNRDGNYLESSASAMFTYALLKATRLGYIDAKYRDVGRRAYRGMLGQFVEIDKDGLVDLTKACQVAGLGGDPEKGERYRDGTFEYYVNEKIRTNDPKVVGPFILASLEMER